MTNLQALLAAGLPELKFEFDKLLAPQTYFKIGGPAEAYISLDKPEKIAELKQFCEKNQLRLTILGGASNVIVSDKGVAGVVLNINITDIEDTGETADGYHFVQAGAGIKTALLVSQTVAMGYTGLEYFLGVPGTLGGAVYNNSHYLSDLMGEHISRVQIIDESYQLVWLDKAACKFAYDYSRFHETSEIILRVEFALKPGNKEESQAKIREATEYRAKTQPLGPPSSGCIFRNTPNNDKLRQMFPQFAERTHVPSGFLIDQAGLKGERIGNIEVSQKHAAWMINHGQGKSEDVLALIKKVKETIKNKYDVELEEEVFFLD